MRFPKMTARRWYWSMMGFGLVWSFAGWRWDGGQKGTLSTIQTDVSWLPETALVPPSFILSSVQAMAQGAFNRYTAAASKESVEELRDKVRALQNENVQLKGMLAEADERLQAVNQLKLLGIKAENVQAANVLGQGTGTGSNLLRLDKGTSSGVKLDDAVVAPLDQVCLLGRVVSVGQLECLVRLVSDPQMNNSVQIVRPMLQTNAAGPGPFEDIAITKRDEPKNLRGLGGGRMQIELVNVQSVEPQKGDLVCLTDAHWPAKTQHMVVGQIDSVGRQQDNPLRYDIRVSSRVALTSQRTVMILINE